MGEPAAEIVFVPRYAPLPLSQRLAIAFTCVLGVVFLLLAARAPSTWSSWLGFLGATGVLAAITFDRILWPRRLRFYGSHLFVEFPARSKSIPYDQIWAVALDRILSERGAVYFGEMENRDEFRNVLNHAQLRGWVGQDRVSTELGGKLAGVENTTAVEVEQDQDRGESRMYRTLRMAILCLPVSWGAAAAIYLFNPTRYWPLLVLLFEAVAWVALHKLRWSEEKQRRAVRWSLWALFGVIILGLISGRIGR